MAMALEGVGPAIAAGTRLSKNKEYAEKLTELPTIPLNSHLKHSLNNIALQENTHFTTFALLYGSNEVQLKLFIEWLPVNNVLNANINHTDDESIKTVIPNRIVYFSKKVPAEKWLNEIYLEEKITSNYPLLVQLIATYAKAISEHEIPQLQEENEGRQDSLVLQETKNLIIALSNQFPATLLVQEK